MKKIYLVTSTTIILGLLFTIKPEWFRFLWGWQLFLLPVISGIFMVLVQNEDRIYRFVPKLIIGSILTSFIFVALWQLIDLVKYDYGDYFVFMAVVRTALIFSLACFFGGLIGIVIRGTTLLLKKNSKSNFVLVLRKIFGVIFLSFGVIGFLTSVVIFLILLFNPASSLLSMVMVDFKLIDVTGFVGYYLLLLSTSFIILIPIFFIVILGLVLFFTKKNFFNFKLFLRLILLFFLWLAIFFFLSSNLESKFEAKKAEMKNNQSEEHFNVKDFNSIYVSRFVAFDEITIKQGDRFDIVASGSQYDLIGLDFKKINDNTLSIERSKLESYYNTKTWKVENENIPFAAGTKYLKIEITMPDIKKIELDGGHLKLDNLKVDNLEIKLNKRFNEIKGDIAVKDTLKLEAVGGVINFTGSAKNLIINSGDCWIEMDKFITENAIINAKNTSRLNVNVSGNLEIQSNENSGITNHYKE
ncbi:MAG: DUF2807 domain-containing protein [Patescibacteria group bacterium]|jgi:hypothetical protein